MLCLKFKPFITKFDKHLRLIFILEKYYVPSNAAILLEDRLIQWEVEC